MAKAGNHSSTQMITPFLWFDGIVSEAIDFYTSVFKDGEVIKSHYLPGETPGVKGRALTATLRLNGVEFYAVGWRAYV